MKAMIFAAGLGTRLGTETADKPKAMVEVGEKPLLQLAIEKLKKIGINEIVVNVHHFAEQIIDFIHHHDFGIVIHISDEREKLLETGGGLKKAAAWLKGTEPILVYNVDIISNIDLIQLKSAHLASGALATLVVRNRSTQRYFTFDNEKQLTGWINTKTGETKVSRPEQFSASSKMAFSGIHIIQPEILELMPDLERFSITDFYLDLAKTLTIKGYFDNSELWIDVGKPEQLAEARKYAV